MYDSSLLLKADAIPSSRFGSVENVVSMRQEVGQIILFGIQCRTNYTFSKGDIYSLDINGKVVRRD